MKTVVIGANSYIARNLIRKLREEQPSCELVLYDWAEAQRDGEEEYHSIRVLEREAMAKANLDCDAIYMFVGKTGSAAGFEAYDSFIDVNERALLNLLDAYRRQHSRAKVIFPSTRLVYQGGPGLLNESAPKGFKTIYAMNKYACEQYLRQYNSMYGVRYCVFRICLPYGSMIPNASSYGTIEFMLSKASKGENISLYGGGNVRRTFTHIEDLCENMIEGALRAECVNDVYNIGGEDMSLREAAEQIAARFHVRVEDAAYPEADKKIETGDTVFDATKLARLGIVPKRSFSKWIEQIEVNRGGEDSEVAEVLLIALLVKASMEEREELPEDRLHNFIIEQYRPKWDAA